MPALLVLVLVLVTPVVEQIGASRGKTGLKPGATRRGSLGRVAGLVFPVAQGFSPAVLFERRFDLSAAAETIATVRAGCERCDWRVPGREAALVIIEIDGRYSQHLMLTRGAVPADYPIMLGRLRAGAHRLRVRLDHTGSARDIGTTTIASVEVAPVAAGSADALAVAMAPLLHARPNSIGRFTDVPVLMWYEIVPAPRGRQFRYSVIFTNEDGGTPTDRLMATWGRTTDIEFVYGVELDAANRLLAEEYQGPDHKILRFRGTREGRHPLLWVATDNNMVNDAGDVTLRYAPAPSLFDLSATSREAVMDASPWTYRVMADEIAREGKIADTAAAVSGTIPDLRRFVFVEACTELENAALSFGVRVREAGGVRWYDADRQRPELRIVRPGCFRGAVPVPAGAGLPDAVRFRVYTKARKPEDPPVPPGRVRLTRVNAVFALRDDFTPGPSAFAWTGSQSLALDGPGFVLEFAR